MKLCFREEILLQNEKIYNVALMKISSEVSSNLQKSTFQSRKNFLDFIFEKFAKFYLKTVFFMFLNSLSASNESKTC